MIEIKFRAWCEEEKRMYHNEEIVFYCGLAYKNFTDAKNQVNYLTEIMPWTGAKDKYGKDIYLDDLILYNDKIQIVRQYESGFDYVVDAIKGAMLTPVYKNFSRLHFINLGNKFENPEIMENILK